MPLLPTVPRLQSTYLHNERWLDGDRVEESCWQLRWILRCDEVWWAIKETTTRRWCDIFVHFDRDPAASSKINSSVHPTHNFSGHVNIEQNHWLIKKRSRDRMVRDPVNRTRFDAAGTKSKISWRRHHQTLQNITLTIQIKLQKEIWCIWRY